MSLKEVATKVGYGTEHGDNNKTIKSRLNKYNIDYSYFSHVGFVKRNEENIFIKDSTAGQTVLRKWYKKGEYTPYICSICGQEPYWNGKELTLILDHINGENHDDRLENLRWVCPNCNQQLDTTGFKKFQAKRIKKKREKKKYYCKECGKEICKNKNGSGLCRRCFNIRKFHIVNKNISREQLKFEIRYFNFREVGRIHNVEDNTIRKWCKKYNLPYHSKEIRKISDEDWKSI